MRWTILALVIVLFLIFDQLNYSGHYGREITSVIEKGAARIAALFR